MQHRQWTVGAIARHYNVQIHRVEYLIHSRGIEPASRAGQLRIFNDAAVKLIGRELDLQQEARRG